MPQSGSIEPMKAILYKKYGSPDVLKLEEVEKPAPKNNEVLIEVHAASVNTGDYYFMTGKPFLVVASAAAPSVAEDGTMAYLPVIEVGLGELQFTMVDRNGKELKEIGDSRPQRRGDCCLLLS